MRYWKFDCRSLISDFERNKKTLASISEAIIVAKGYLKRPLKTEAISEVEAYIEMLQIKEAEFRLYTDMVILGINELPEIERNVLKWWLIDGKDDARIMYDAGIETRKDLTEIKNISLGRFAEIIMPT